MDIFDLAVVGGGVIGVATLRSCLQQYPGLNACLIERELELSLHQSGRNSGVIHAGYNQKPGTIKAKFVVEGNYRIKQYCRGKGIPLSESGIVVIAKNQQEESVLKELLTRGQKNGARVELIDHKRLLQLEPHAAGHMALFAAEAASFDARGYVLSLASDAKSLGGQFFSGETVTNLHEQSNFVEVETEKRLIKTKVLVCAGGLHADRLAHKLGLGKKYTIVPFRGEYYELIANQRNLVRSHIYPAPNLHFPFLGVHLSRTFDGRVLVGPGAVLALGRESYSVFKINFPDLIEMVSKQGFWKLFITPEFQAVAKQEWKKSLFSQEVTKEAQQLLPELHHADLVKSRAGIRAQLVSESGELVDDLIVEESPRTIHVLNAVSPALTCSLPFADYIREQVSKKLSVP